MRRSVRDSTYYHRRSVHLEVIARPLSYLLLISFEGREAGILVGMIQGVFRLALGPPRESV